MATHKLAILVSAVGAAKAAKDLKGVDAAISGIGARSGKGIRSAADNIGKLAVGAAGLAAVGLVAAVKAAGDFEAQLNTINTVAGLTSDQLAEVGTGIRALARDTGSSLSDLTGAYYDLVSAGIKPGADALKVLTLANTLAIGGLGTTAETVDLLTTAINTYHLSAAGAAKATDMFAEAIALGKVTASELSSSFAIVGPLAKSAGIGIDEIAAAYGTLTAKGVPAAEAATQMRSAIVALMKPTAALSTAEDKLHVNFAKVAKQKGLVAALQMIRDYSQKTGIPMVKLMGRIEGVNFALSTTGANADDYASALAKVRAATGVAADQMSERQKGLNYELARLKALAIDAGVTLGSKLLPKLTPLAEKAVAFLETHQGDIDKFGDNIASAFEKAAAFAEKVPWGTIGSGLQVAAEWSGKLMDTFMAMPRDVQTTIIALAGLNKLSGGAITGVIGELGKGLIKGVLGMNAGVVNINAGVVNGGGGLGPAAAGAAGAGALTTGLALTTAVVAPLAVAAAGTMIQDGLNKQADALSTQASNFAKVATDAQLEAAIASQKAQLDSMAFNTFDSKNKIVAVSNQLIGELNRRRTSTAGTDASDPRFENRRKDTQVKEAIDKSRTDTIAEQLATTRAVNDAKARSAIGFLANQNATTAAGQNVASVTRSGTSGTTAATNVGSSRIVSAIGANRPIITTTVNVNVSAAQVTKSTTTQERYGSGTGSSGSGSNAGYNDPGK